MSKPVLVALLALVSACGVELDGDGTGPDLDPSLSPIGHTVVDALRAKHSGMQGRTWSVATDDAFEPGWILQTPSAEYWGQPVSALPVASDCAGNAKCDPDFGLIACTAQADCTFGGTCTAVLSTVTRPGDAPRRLCTGHSDAFYDQIYGVITSAQHYVDLASLEAPDGRFEAAVRNAVTFLARSNRDVRVRLLYGAVPGRSRTTAEVLGTLTRDLEASSSVRVGVGAYRDSIESWNHTKLIGGKDEQAGFRRGELGSDGKGSGRGGVRGLPRT